MPLLGRRTAAFPASVLAVVTLGASGLVGAGSAVVAEPKPNRQAVTAAKKYTVSMTLPKKAVAKKRTIKVTFSPKKPKTVKLQRWKKSKYVTIATVAKPGGKAVWFGFTPAKNKKSKTKLRAVATWKKHRAVTPGRTTRWTPKSTTSTAPGGSSATGTGLDANGDPTANIGEPSALDACWAYGASDARCRTAAVYALNLGRAREGLARFTLPSNWTSLTPAQQLLHLTNDERRVRGLKQVARLSTPLNAIALTGAAANTDPILSSWTVEGRSAFGWAGNWAITPGGPIYSTFLWMYDDGLGSGNIHCTATNRSGCWGHRHNILAFGDADSSTQLVLGAAETRTTYAGWSGLSDATILVKLAL